MSSIVRGNIRMALSSVRSAKWRSVLTMLGVVVGIVSVVTVVGIGEGVKRQIAGQLTHFGGSIITVRPGSAANQSILSAPKNSSLLFGLGTSAGLTTNDVGKVEQTPGVAEAAPLGLAAGTIRADDDGSVLSPPILITNSHLATVLKQAMTSGSFWDDTDDDAHVAVIGSKAALSLFGQPVPLGHSLLFRGQAFVVRGVFAPFRAAPFSGATNFDNAIFLPYKATAALTGNSSGIFVILAQSSHDQVASTVTALTSNLKAAHGGLQDFSVLSPKQAATQTNAAVRVLSEWIIAVAAISLLIGGVGIMNIMLLSVTERMHEIGVRKAIGASSRQVLGQFITEATVLSLVGGVVGIALSLAVDGLLYLYTNFKPVISWRAMVVATLVSLAVGVIFGTAPAVKAARKDPIEALRHE
ncbi:MAG TPA: ABC transporter permease [Candidatus Saccharimonadales bacterium]|nr:ABC transporter permease [Candidatus Saccharimonadales bacterium]